MRTTPQEDLLIVEALVRLGHDYDGAENSERAWRLARAMAAEHGLEPVDVARQYTPW